MSVSSSTPFRLNARIQTLEESEGDSDVFDNQGASVNIISIFWISKNINIFSKDEDRKLGGLANGQIHAKRKRLSTTGYSQSVSSPSAPVKKKHRTGFDTPEIDISKDPLQFFLSKDEEGNLIGNFKAKVLFGYLCF